MSYEGPEFHLPPSPESPGETILVGHSQPVQDIIPFRSSGHEYSCAEAQRFGCISRSIVIVIALEIH